MRITYVANIRMPTERAHGAQIVHMCDAFTRAGAEVTLVVPARKNDITENTFSYYGFSEKPFSDPVYVPVYDTVSRGKLGFLVESVSFAWGARNEIAPDSIVYGRDELILLLLYFFGVQQIVWESHTGAWNIAARFLARKAMAVIVISKGLERWYVERGVQKEKLFVAHDGVTVADFARPFDKQSERERLGLSTNKKIALYVGGLDEGKGADVFCKSASFLSTDVQAVVIGGREKQIAEFKNNYPKVLFLGQRPYKELPQNQSLADVVVIPNSEKLQVWSTFTSPLKLFSALASMVPVVASATQSILEVVDGNSVYLVTPDNARALADGIKIAVENKEGKPQRARELAARYDWLERAKQVITFISARKA